MTDRRGLAQQERKALADLLAEVGPDAPTLCEGWATIDLAAHLVLRERRLDAAPGIVLRPLAGYTERVQREIARRPYLELVELVRTGPPRWSPTALRAVDDAANTAEFFVHHEDVRRAKQSWEPRPPNKALEDLVWSRLRSLGRLLVRRSPVGVSVAQPEGEAVAELRRGARSVTLTGPPTELLLYLFGRKKVARVTLDGSPDDVAAFEATPLGT